MQGRTAPPRTPAEKPWQEAGSDVAEPPHARWDLAVDLGEDLTRPRAPSDGGGRAWIEGAEGARPTIVAQQAGSWTIQYEAGPLGIDEGGAIYFMPGPFWGWSPPQNEEPRAYGYTTVATTADGVTLEPESLGELLAIHVGGAALPAGARVSIVYGAGSLGARADRHAERQSRLWVAVDGDGDGVRAVLADSPAVDVLPGPPERLALSMTSTARPGGRVRLTIAVLDLWANTDVAFTGTIALEGAPPGWEVPASVEIAAEDRASKTIEFVAATAGVCRIRGRATLGEREEVAESNPSWVDDAAPGVLWGDLHGHSNFSDGTGMPEDYFHYARDVAGLDVAALTDHDHYGVLFLDQHPEMWAEIQKQVARYHQPGRFVTLLAYEWTSWIHGHRHVLYFEDEGVVHSSLDGEVDTPSELWARLRGQKALTFAHHSAGDPIPTNWTFAPDPELEPVTEVMSVHGSSEAVDSPSRIGGAIPGNFVRDALDHGYHLGFIGSGDGHDGHPGLAHLSPVYRWMRRMDGQELMGTGGLAGIRASEATREAVLQAMRARAVWATSGPRIIVDVTLDGHVMGATIPRAELGETSTFAFRVLGTAPIERLDRVRSGEVEPIGTIEAGQRDLEGAVVLPDLHAKEYLYLRVIQTDQALAWSSPFFVD
jgi:hypothetical protein